MSGRCRRRWPAMSSHGANMSRDCLNIKIMFTRPITYQLTEAVRGYTFTYNN